VLENTDRRRSWLYGLTRCFPALVETIPAAEGRPCAVEALTALAALAVQLFSRCAAFAVLEMAIFFARE
jgi:hypothetical protein